MSTHAIVTFGSTGGSGVVYTRSHFDIAKKMQALTQILQQRHGADVWLGTMGPGYGPGMVASLFRSAPHAAFLHHVRADWKSSKSVTRGEINRDEYLQKEQEITD